jgi:glycyl-tRNA synthetase
MVGVDCSIIMNPKVWEASGHATGFADPMVDCKECKSRFRADQLYVRGFSRTTSIEQARSEKLEAGSVMEEIVGEINREVEGGATLEQAQALPRIQQLLLASARMCSPVILVKTVIASSADDAESALKLTKTEQKLVGDRPGGIKFLPYGLAQHMHAMNLIPPPPCPNCSAPSLTEPRLFNLMFETFVGAVQDESAKAFLRPETAQGIFANFKNVLDTTRVKVPFGIAQVGKSFRNEINPRNFTFRSREFEQMEIEFFCKGNEATRQQGNKGEITDMEWYAFWRKVRYDWYVNLGLKSEKLRLRDQGPEELAHYSKACADIEYLFPFSDEHQELEGVAHRGCFDLTQHQKHSGKDLTYFDDEAWLQDQDKYPDKEVAKEVKNKEPYRFVPTVIEPSAGADRATLAFLCEAYTEDQAPDEKGVLQTRVVMKFHPRLAPIKVAVFPLVNKEGMPDLAEALYKDLKKHMTAFYDDKGAIGRRYRRQDEAGTPFCITVDGDTLKDGTVTIRDRDTLQQVRVPKAGVVAWVRERIS